MLQAYAKAKRKELSQIITIYQSVLEFAFEELWMEITIKHNKEDVDNMLDDINAKLIEVCDEYLKENNNIRLDKYQLSMIVMDLYTKTITQLPQPFYVQARESKNLMKEYVKANKEYIEKAKKVKRENETLLEEASKLEKQNRQLKSAPKETLDIETTNTTIKVKDREIPITKQVVPHKPAKPSKFKYKNHDTYTLADTFTF